MIIDMRLPVTSSRRCEQITAFGRVGGARREDERPDRVDVGLDARVVVADTVERVGERRAERRFRIGGIGEAGRVEDRRQLGGDRREQRFVAGLGEHEAAMRVLGIAQEVLAPARVVQADDRAADERGAAEREQVVGRVVEQHRDVRRRALRQSLEEEVREAHRLDEVLAMGPDPIAEPDRRSTADVGVGRVRAQERGGVRRDERRLPRRRHRSGMHT